MRGDLVSVPVAVQYQYSSEADGRGLRESNNLGVTSANRYRDQ